MHGGEPLSTEELIALVLGTGRRGHSAVEVARALLGHAGGLNNLSRASPRELEAVPGVGLARASRLVAAFHLGRRALAKPGEAPVMLQAADVFRYLRPRLGGMVQEVFCVLALDARNNLIAEIEVARGTLTAVEVHPREVFRPLVRQAAAAAVVAHNHPSGDPRPSEEDLELTARLRRAGDLLGIPILDHVVIGAEGYVSLAEMLGDEDDHEEEP